MKLKHTALWSGVVAAALLLTACGLLFLVGLWPLSLFVLLLLCAFQRR